jgi:hypothetical protein
MVGLSHDSVRLGELHRLIIPITWSIDPAMSMSWFGAMAISTGNAVDTFHHQNGLIFGHGNRPATIAPTVGQATDRKR